MNKNILIIAGEPSGDMRAGELLEELRSLLPDFSFWGIGGSNMEKRGADLIEHVRRFSIVGLWEAITSLPRIRRQYNNVIKNIRERKPSAAILIDYPGFNLQLAGYLHRRKIPVAYYIIPQVWAWGRGRIRALRKHADKILVLFKFEEEFLRKAGIDCEFVGHPLLDKAPPSKERGKKPRGRITIALLPGSRKSEILNIFPAMLDAAENIIRYKENVSFTIAENSNIDRSLYDSALAPHGALSVSRLTDDTFRVLADCDFAVVTSGTATLEAAVMEKPMIIVYRAPLMTPFLLRAFVRIPFIGLVNIIAGKKIVPELLQRHADPKNLSGKVLEIINDVSRMRQMQNELRKVRLSLGGKGASRRAARAIARLINAD